MSQKEDRFGKAEGDGSQTGPLCAGDVNRDSEKEEEEMRLEHENN